MATTVIGTIESTKAAQALVSELVSAGLKKQDIEVLDGAREGDRGADRRARLRRGRRQGLRKAARGGKTLVVAQAPDQKIDQAVAIIERHEAEGGEASKEQGETVQEVEEELAVGKRKAATGGVRVTTNVSERPVEETVTLREEQVSAERKPADRALSPEEAEAAFQGKTVELLGHQRGGRGLQAGPGGRRGRGRQVGRGARGDGEGHGAAHRGRGRGGRRQGAQEPLSTASRNSFSEARHESAGLFCLQETTMNVRDFLGQGGARRR